MAPAKPQPSVSTSVQPHHAYDINEDSKPTKPYVVPLNSIPRTTTSSTLPKLLIHTTAQYDDIMKLPQFSVRINVANHNLIAGLSKRWSGNDYDTIVQDAWGTDCTWFRQYAHEEISHISPLARALLCLAIFKGMTMRQFHQAYNHSRTMRTFKRSDFADSRLNHIPASTCGNEKDDEFLDAMCYFLLPDMPENYTWELSDEACDVLQLAFNKHHILNSDKGNMDGVHNRTLDQFARHLGFGWDRKRDYVDTATLLEVYPDVCLDFELKVQSQGGRLWLAEKFTRQFWSHVHANRIPPTNLKRSAPPPLPEDRIVRNANSITYHFMDKAAAGAAPTTPTATASGSDATSDEPGSSTAAPHTTQGASSNATTGNPLVIHSQPKMPAPQENSNTPDEDQLMGSIEEDEEQTPPHAQDKGKEPATEDDESQPATWIREFRGLPMVYMMGEPSMSTLDIIKQCSCGDDSVRMNVNIITFTMDTGGDSNHIWLHLLTSQIRAIFPPGWKDNHTPCPEHLRRLCKILNLRWENEDEEEVIEDYILKRVSELEAKHLPRNSLPFISEEKARTIGERGSSEPSPIPLDIPEAITNKYEKQLSDYHTAEITPCYRWDLEGEADAVLKNLFIREHSAILHHSTLQGSELLFEDGKHTAFQQMLQQDANLV